MFYAVAIKVKALSAVALITSRSLVRVRCTYCKRQHNYLPEDLIQIFGDVDVDSLMQRMVCEKGDHGSMDVKHLFRQALRLSDLASGDSAC